MPKKMFGALTTIWWMDSTAASVADLPAISLAHWTADVTANLVSNYTDAIVAGYTLNPTDSDTDDTAMLGDSNNAKRRGLYNYEAKFQFAREDDLVANPTSIYEAVLTKFKVRGVNGYWTRRIGFSKTTPVAIGHKLRVFKVESFRPRTIDSEKGKPIWLEVNFGQQGYMSVPTAVVA